MNIFYKVVFILFVIAAAVLFFNPSIDLQVSQCFYRPGEGFFMREVWWVQFFYKLVPILVYILVAGFILFFILVNVYKRKFLGLGNRELIYLLLVLLVGPGLMVNAVFKEQLGRARPYEIVNFGGDKQFSRPLVIENKYANGHSFSSGHAAIGFYFMAIALLFRRWQKTAFLFSVLLGFLIGFGRILQGDHFLSDVVYSGLVVFLVVYTFYYLILVREAKKIPL